jgi:predicted DNA-binding protein (UPF0251 family)
VTLPNGDRIAVPLGLTGEQAAIYVAPDEVRCLKDEQKLGASEIATRLGIGRASVYRVLKEAMA